MNLRPDFLLLQKMMIHRKAGYRRWQNRDVTYIYMRAMQTALHQKRMRGRIVEWNPSAKSREEILKIKAFDTLYDLQESKDNVYFSSERVQERLSPLSYRSGI